MALLKIQLPRTLRGNHSLECVFYHRYPNLRRVRVTRFSSINTLSTVLESSLFAAKNKLILSPSLFGFEHLNKIYIHPDGLLKLIRRRAKREAIQDLKNSQKVSPQ